MGIFVSTVDSNAVGRQLSSLLSYNLETLEHIYEVRILLEKASAFWAAERCTEEDYQRIRSLLEEARSVDPVDYADRFVDLNRNFHLCIAEASQNPVVAMMTENILNLLETTSDETHTIPGRALRSIDEHEKVLTAIVERRPDEAKKTMEEHLSSVLTTLRNNKDSEQS
ncbi:hypothetical protein N752_16280 [Desulforamulus aquiferis]|nr:FCD domain-containing protein [Desulforamulus aquiferis]RYD04134.1 hypothetical protein N752_16280 [Desulforamulus aquiferis]